MNEKMNDLMDGWMSGWLKEWINESMSEWKKKKRIHKWMATSNQYLVTSFLLIHHKSDWHSARTPTKTYILSKWTNKWTNNKFYFHSLNKNNNLVAGVEQEIWKGRGTNIKKGGREGEGSGKHKQNI